MESHVLACVSFGSTAPRLEKSNGVVDFNALRDACHAVLTTYINDATYEAQEQGMFVYRPAAKGTAKPAKWRATYLPVFRQVFGRLDLSESLLADVEN